MTQTTFSLALRFKGDFQWIHKILLPAVSFTGSSNFQADISKSEHTENKNIWKAQQQQD